MSFRVQVGNERGEFKWDANSLSQHDKIRAITARDGESGRWSLEKHETDPLWSFYVETGSSNVSKLYVTYNKTSPDELTMELRGDRDSPKERYFRARIHPSGRLLLQPSSTDDKFIGIETGCLALVEAEKREEWIIDHDITDTTFVQGDVGVQLKKMIISGQTAGLLNTVEEGDNVMLGASGDDTKFEWSYTGDVGAKVFQKPGSNPALYIIKEIDNTASLSIVLGQSPVNEKMKQFKHSVVHSADVFQSLVGDKYIGPNSTNKFIELVDSGHKIEWDQSVSRMTFTQTVEMGVKEFVVFPAFKMRKVAKDD